MKTAIQKRVKQAIEALIQQQVFTAESADTAIHIERTKDPLHGDFACNIAMQLARTLKKNPREIASLLVQQLDNDSLFAGVEIAGPGFINFRLSQSRYNDLVGHILSEGERFGTVTVSADAPKLLLEFVSANPTGPLHVGHGRGAAYGASLANILRASGQKVDCEYYVNDAGRQMDILAVSVYLRYLSLCQMTIIYPQNAYQANYISEIAYEVFIRDGDKYLVDDTFFNDLPIRNYEAFVESNTTLSAELNDCETRLSATDKVRIEEIKAIQAEQKTQSEQFIDVLIARAKEQCKNDGYTVFFDAALSAIRGDIEEDLREFGVEYQYWYSEKSLFNTGKIEAAIKVLQDKGHLYEKNGAIWFRTTDFGDEKDRVVQRDNGAYTYFASDIAYHHDKIERGYDQLVDIFGADHHGYMARVKAALTAFGHNEERLRFELVQFAVLYKGGKKLSMSTRSGKYVTLRDLRQMIGNSAARFFYVMRKPQQHMDFDLDMAVATNKDNPLYYIQYAHARIGRLLRKADETGIVTKGEFAIDKLESDYEQTLLRLLEKYPDVVQSAANDYAPHQLIHYLKALATALHSYYDAGNVKFLDNDNLQISRFALLKATKQVLANGLQLSGVEAPEVM